jgi:hypothetical protein
LFIKKFKYIEEVYMNLVSRFLLPAASVLIMASFITFIACSAAPGGGGGSSSASSKGFTPVVALSNIVQDNSTLYMSDVGSTNADNGSIVTNGTNVGVLIDANSILNANGGSFPVIQARWTLLNPPVDMSQQNFVINFDIYFYSNTYYMLTNPTQGSQLQVFMSTATYTLDYTYNLMSFVTNPASWCHVSTPMDAANIGYPSNPAVSGWQFTYFSIQLATPSNDSGLSNRYIIANVVISNTN